MLVPSHSVLDSPFPHHGPLKPEQVRGRDELLIQLTEKVTAHRVTALLGPRRYGKTSVLRRLGADLAEAGTSVVWVDLYAVRSFADLAARLDEALDGTSGAHRSTLDRLAASVEFNLGVVKARFQRPDRPVPETTAHTLLDLLVDASELHPTLVVMDEFSSIGGVEGAAGLLRTKFQHHYQELAIVFAGSEPSTMRALFEDRDEPFYAQADLVVIEPLSAVAIDEIVAEGWEGRPPPGLAGRIFSATGGHPQRAMQLADAAWVIAPPDTDPPPDLWGQVLETVRAQTDAGHEVRYSSMPSADQAVLRIVAASESIFGRAGELLDLSASSGQNARRRLIDTGQLAQRGEELFVVDPLFADWLRRRFPL